MSLPFLVVLANLFLVFSVSDGFGEPAGDQAKTAGETRKTSVVTATDSVEKATAAAVAKTSAGDVGPPAYQIKVSQSGVVEMGQTILVGVFGSFAKEIEAKLTSDAASVADSLKLYLNGVQMAGIVPTFLDSKAFVFAPDDKTNPAFVLQFPVERDANNEANRKAWDSLLSGLKFGEQTIQVGVGLDNGIPHLAGPGELRFQVASGMLIGCVIVIGLVIFALLMWWAIASPMLRESGPNTAYSLGKTQMAFWGLLVALSFFGVWIVGHKMERIPPQVLILLGISGTTGLGSLLIGKSKKASAADEEAKLQKGKADSRKKQAVLTAEETALKNDQAAGGTAWTSDKAQRLAAVTQELANLKNEEGKIDTGIADLRKAAGATTSSGNCFTDIISDANGVSFHRFQVVLWTIILGVIFVCTVSNTFTMPEFENTLLILMGISNGTYLGFKIPEKEE